MNASADNAKIQRLLIVSGCAGAGKSVVLHQLEDAGYYCVDNLPLHLLAPLASSQRDALVAAQTGLVAVCIDVRSTNGDMSQFESTLKRIRDEGLDVSVLYVDAGDETLIQRFSATHRNHPLANPKRDLSEAIQLERKLLEPVHALAERYIDTSQLSTRGLQDWLTSWLKLKDADVTASVLLQSFGYQHGVPRDADLVFDVRCLPNPYWDGGLRAMTGRDRLVQAFMRRQPKVSALIDDILSFVEEWLPEYCERRNHVSVGIGCTGGRHRSVYVAVRMYQRLTLSGTLAQIHHRDIDK